MPDLLVVVPPISAGPLMPEALGGPAADGGATPSRRLRNSAIPILGAILLIAVLVGLHEQISGGVRSLLALEPEAMAIVCCCVIVLVVSRATVNRLTHPETSIGRGFVLDQISLAATNGLPGGVVLGPAARYRVSRSFGHSPEQSAVGTFAAGQAFCLGRWLLVLIVIGHEFAFGSPSAADSMLLVSALAAVAVGIAVWMVLVTESAVSCRLTQIAQRPVDRLGLRWRKLRNRDVAAIASSMRSSATWMARRRACALIVIGAVSTLASGAIIVAVVTTFDSVVGDPDPWTLMRVYLVARVATSFVPTPGALAALDAALIAGLLGAGVDPQIATAAVLIYRATTFVLPILLGGATYLGWRRWSGRQDVDSQVATPVAA